MAGLKVITAPVKEPVKSPDVKTQLRIEDDDTSYDDILTPLITAAREWCEGYQNRVYITQTLELALDGWPHCDYVDLPRPPLQEVSSVKYTDDGTEMTWSDSNYVVDDYAFVARLVRARGVCWPIASLPSANGIKIRYVAGYGNDGDDVPQTIKQAIILRTIQFFEQGMQCDASPAVIALLNQERVVPV